VPSLWITGLRIPSDQHATFTLYSSYPGLYRPPARTRITMNMKQNYILDFEALLDDIFAGPMQTPVTEPVQMFCTAASQLECRDSRAGMLDSTSPTSVVAEDDDASVVTVLTPPGNPLIWDRKWPVSQRPGSSSDANDVVGGQLDLASEIPDPSSRWQAYVDQAEAASCDRRRWLQILRTIKPVLSATEYKAMQVYRRKIRDRNHANNSRRQRQRAEQGLLSEMAHLETEIVELRAENARLRGLVSSIGSSPEALPIDLQL